MSMLSAFCQRSTPHIYKGGRTWGTDGIADAAPRHIHLACHFCPKSSSCRHSCAHLSSGRRSRSFPSQSAYRQQRTRLEETRPEGAEGQRFSQHWSLCSAALEGATHSKPSINHAADHILVVEWSPTCQTRRRCRQTNTLERDRSFTIRRQTGFYGWNIGDLSTPRNMFTLLYSSCLPVSVSGSSWLSIADKSPSANLSRFPTHPLQLHSAVLLSP